MAYTNDVVADNFIKQTGLKSNGSTCMYIGDIFYSYNTAFAKVDLKRKVVMISNEGMTSTSSKHRSALVSSAIDNNFKILPVPLKMFEHTFPSADELNERFEQQLDDLATGTNLALADYRFRFIDTLSRYEEYNRYIENQPKQLNKFVKIEAKLEDISFIKDLQKQRRLELKKNK